MPLHRAKNEQPSKAWNFQPDLTQQAVPYYDWPPRPIKVLRRLLSAWSVWDVRIYVLALSAITWHFFSPSLIRCQQFAFDWIAQIWLRHFLLIALLAGGLHLYFYTFKKQAKVEKYDARELNHKPEIFHFKSQLLDNVLWVILSTVSFLTVFEVLTMWAYANGYIELIQFTQTPLLFLALFLLVPVWTGFHFYWQHRFFHLRPFYKMGHHWHHKNVNVGPWSGAAVHPFEALIWFSAVLVLWLIPSHPIHAIFLMQLQVITAITTHCGYEHLYVGKTVKFSLGDFFHQLHHRHYQYNYGTIAGPWDRLFGTYHDGRANKSE